MNEMPIAELCSGLRIGNFSSPYPLTFEDGTVLPACSEVRANSLLLDVEESGENNGRWTDLKTSHSLSDAVYDEAGRIVNKELGSVDVILVPEPVLAALQCQEQEGEFDYAVALFLRKARTARVKDHASGIIYADRFCR